MATALENLKTARDAVALELANFDYGKTTYSIDGQSVQWDAHLANLMAAHKGLNEQIAALDVGEVISQVRATG